ncbi:MAG TPA: hypothetical protein DCM87_08495 [Planctomycetes bacterium]|nr:hypothetical protein [Planctomycetota bacterium]
MSALLAVVHLVSLCALGFALASLLARRPGGAPRGGLFVLSVAPGIAFLINGCATFARLYTGAFGPETQALVCIALGAAALAYCIRRRAFPAEWRARAEPASPIERRLTLVGGVLCAVIWIAFVAGDPEGPVDAWRNWNLKARFMWSAPESWRALFGPDFPGTNADYPILLPLNTAALFTLAGDDTCLAPITIAACFTIALVGLMRAACAELGGGRTAWCLLLMTPCLAPYAARQYADVEMSYFLLAGTAALFFALRDGGARDYLLAGVWAGAAAFTKNEGLPYLAGAGAAAAAGALAACARRRNARPFGGFLACLAGMAAGGSALWLFKADVARHAFAIETMPIAVLGVPPDLPARAGTMCLRILAVLAKPSVWALLPVAIAAVWAGTRVAPGGRGGAAALAGAPLAFVLAAYCAVVLIAPVDPDWLVSGSAGRVIFQVWPGFLFLWAARTIAPANVNTCGAVSGTRLHGAEESA